MTSSIVDTITDDFIENKISVIICTTPHVSFSQYAIYDKITTDLKLNHNDILFKERFLSILRSMMSKYDYIHLDYKDNCYFIQLKKATISVINFGDNNINNSKNNLKMIHNMQTYIVNTRQFKEKYEGLYNYDETSTIYHEIVETNNIDLIKQLIENNTFDCFILNKNFHIPLELCKNDEILKIMLQNVKNKVVNLNHLMNNVSDLNEINIIDKITKHVINCEKYKTIEYENSIIKKYTIIDILRIKYYTLNCIFSIFINLFCFLKNIIINLTSLCMLFIIFIAIISLSSIVLIMLFKIFNAEYYFSCMNVIEK